MPDALKDKIAGRLPRRRGRRQHRERLKATGR
jgi:hypothetical protein